MAGGSTPSGLDNLNTLLDLYSKAKGSSSSQTTRSDISQTGVTALLNQILSSNQGLAAVASGQRGAGLYNSTVNQQLVNDLLTRTAGEVGKLQAGTTTTSNKPGAIGLKDVMGLGGAALLKSVLGPTISGIGKKYGVGNIGDKIASSLGVDDASQALANVPASTVDPADFNYLDSIPDVTSSLADLGSSLATDTAVDTTTTTVADNTSEDLFSSLFG